MSIYTHIVYAQRSLFNLYILDRTLVDSNDDRLCPSDLSSSEPT